MTERSTVTRDFEAEQTGTIWFQLGARPSQFNLEQSTDGRTTITVEGPADVVDNLTFETVGLQHLMVYGLNDHALGQTLRLGRTAGGQRGRSIMLVDGVRQSGGGVAIGAVTGGTVSLSVGSAPAAADQFVVTIATPDPSVVIE